MYPSLGFFFFFGALARSFRFLDQQKSKYSVSLYTEWRLSSNASPDAPTIEFLLHSMWRDEFYYPAHLSGGGKKY